MVPTTIIMNKLLAFLLFISLSCSQPAPDPIIKKYEEQAARVTIIRDNWGVPHIYGKTDADAVFGLLYVQCEESFERVERNYLRKFGRMAEVEGPAYLTEDLKMRLIYDTAIARADYNKSPQWLKELCNAFADGINYYLYKHPETRPVVLRHFEPWFPMMLTDGAYIATQLGGLESADIKNLYLPDSEAAASFTGPEKRLQQEATGSNGFAIGPSRTKGNKTLLYINPHVTFDFRTEAHIVSEQGLNAYGAVTWGQFFIFQGFNEHCGWMHTSSMADAADLYSEKIVQKDGLPFYEYEKQLKPVGKKQQVLTYKSGAGLKIQSILTYYTHHGPVVGSRKDQWLSLRSKNQSVTGLIQSWHRTKATNFAEFEASMQLLSNNSTNTLYADDKGNIAYWHGNFIPRRNADLDCSLPLDGTIAVTEWDSMYALNEIVQVHNPANGWIQNCNSSPFTATGESILDRKSYPEYMAPEGENFRSVYAIQALGKEDSFTLEKLISFGNSKYLAAFDSMLPPLLTDLSMLPTSHPAYETLNEPGKLLREWDRTSTVSSVATTIAILWGYSILSNNKLPAATKNANDQVAAFTYIINNTPSQERIDLLAGVIRWLEQNHGKWNVPWGEINRYQRVSGEVNTAFDDAKNSWPVAAASALFGSLPAYETEWGKTKGYGIAGNSFVAAVEFGPRIRAMSIVAGGQSFIPGSKHFIDQAPLYIEGKFKEVLFYKEDVLKQKERMYHPGE